MLVVREHIEELLALLQLSMLGEENSRMNCFQHPSGYPEAVLQDVCERLGVEGGSETAEKSDAEFRKFVEAMVDNSVTNGQFIRRTRRRTSEAKDE
eukprot:NODE_19766_length_828_cov_4.490728.p1 GENE.NODE_19766_length_828_cov_4.490728~~NODE_19766_length_828_cov_4.490728.p1  ORF type:complete len:96 (+),score=20.56 NODE_19766_length_828_cov_4.490728:426-713(+)